jgi:hypothetical protein
MNTESRTILKLLLPEFLVDDFPLRGKQVALFAKRRRWIHKETKQVTSKDWNLIAKETHMTADFASFLKGIN